MATTSKANEKTPDPAPEPTRHTMAPAAVDPAGADDRRPARTGDNKALEAMPDERFAELEDAVRTERARRGRRVHEPSYGISEGERADLEMRGKTTSPWTGEEITGDGKPRTRQDSDR